MEPRSPDLIGVDELAGRLGFDRKTVTRALERGELPGHRIGRQWRISWNAVVAQCSQPRRVGMDQATATPARVQLTRATTNDWARRALQQPSTRYSERSAEGKEVREMDDNMNVHAGQTWKNRG